MRLKGAKHTLVGVRLDGGRMNPTKPPARNAERATDYRPIWPPRLVWVYDGGCWRKGQLEGLRQTRAGSFALVRRNPRIHTMPGEPRWVPARNIRLRNESSTPRGH